MKRYIIIDSEEWLSTEVYKTFDAAVKEAQQLLGLESWRETEHFKVYELDSCRATFLPYGKVTRDEVTVV